MVKYKKIVFSEGEFRVYERGKILFVNHALIIDSSVQH